MDRRRDIEGEGSYGSPLKRMLYCQVYSAAQDSGVTLVTARKVIKTFLSVCREDLLSGHIVRLLGLVTMKPDVVVTPHIKTLAFYVKQVSEEVNVPYHTCFAIVTSYLDDLKLGLFRMERAILGNLAIIMPLQEENTDNLVAIYVRASSTIYKDIHEGNTIISSVDTRVSKFLKEDLARAIKCGYENDLRVVVEQ